MGWGFSVVGSPSTKWDQQILDFGPGAHNLGWLELLWSDGALLTSLHRKSPNSGCFFAGGKLKSWNGGSHKQLWTLQQSLRHRLSRKSPLEHSVTAQWRAIFHCENVCLPPKISCDNAHPQKQCIWPNRNGGMKYRGKMYCFQVRLVGLFPSKTDMIVPKWDWYNCSHAKLAQLLPSDTDTIDSLWD